jgi:hypothetical protein
MVPRLHFATLKRRCKRIPLIARIERRLSFDLHESGSSQRDDMRQP